MKKVVLIIFVCLSMTAFSADIKLGTYKAARTFNTENEEPSITEEKNKSLIDEGISIKVAYIKKLDRYEFSLMEDEETFDKIIFHISELVNNSLKFESEDLIFYFLDNEIWMSEVDYDGEFYVFILKD